MAGDERVIDYLREARADELALARTLKSHIATAPRGDYRSGLQGYLRETRGHARRVHNRLDELGAREGSLRSGARALREAGGGVLALGRRPLKAVATETMLVIEYLHAFYAQTETRANALAQQELHRLINDFLNLASHELNTPLTVVKGNIQLAQHRLMTLKRQLTTQPKHASEQIERARRMALELP